MGAMAWSHYYDIMVEVFAMVTMIFPMTKTWGLKEYILKRRSKSLYLIFLVHLFDHVNLKITASVHLTEIAGE